MIATGVESLVMIGVDKQHFNPEGECTKQEMIPPGKHCRPASYHIFILAFKDGAYYCYCAYLLRISRYSDFLSPLFTNTEIFLRGLRLSRESRP